MPTEFSNTFNGNAIFSLRKHKNALNAQKISKKNDGMARNSLKIQNKNGPSVSIFHETNLYDYVKMAKEEQK